MGPLAGHAQSNRPQRPPLRHTPTSRSSYVSSPSQAPTPSLLIGQRMNLASPGLCTPGDPISTTFALPAEPGAPRHVPVMTPPDELTGEPDLNVLAAGAAAAPTQDLPATPAPPPRSRLRLPSFRSLGIAVPHPDRLGRSHTDDISGTSLLRESLRHDDGIAPVSCPSQSLSPAPGPVPVPHHAQSVPPLSAVSLSAHSPIPYFITTLTPPAEGGELSWSSVAPIQADPLEGSHALGPERPSHRPAIALPIDPDAQQQAPGAAQDTAGDNGLSPYDGLWYEGAVRSVIQNLRPTSRSHNPLRVLSHALPSPSPEGHAFPEIISALHESTPASPTIWINVFHAVAGRFNLADLPTSPPSTPGPPTGGDDYFTQNIFDSAVVVPDYQGELSSLPRSPRPVVPPSSIDLSIVERYIPPTNAREFADMFNVNGPSVLVDRLVELSPDNGSLVFIYPTRAGAQTFMREYLSPILDPLLRSMVVVHGLSAEMSVALGGMSAVDQLPEHAALEARMHHLCARLTQRSSSMDRFHGTRAHFDVVHASRQDVTLPRDVWTTHWWSRQEKPRIRDAVTRSVQDAQRKSSNEHVERNASPIELVQQLLDGVARKPYPSGRDPECGVEISVFVIKRSG